jgi:hypothetical protein
MRSTVVCEDSVLLIYMRILILGTVDKAVEYILAQPDGVFYAPLKDTEQALTALQLTERYMCILGRGERGYSVGDERDTW